MFTADNHVIDLSVQMFRMISPFYVIFIISEVLSGAIKGIGDTFKPMVLTLIGTCGFRIIWIVYILPKSSTVMMAILGYPVSWIISTVMFSILYFFTSRGLANFEVESTS